MNMNMNYFFMALFFFDPLNIVIISLPPPPATHNQYMSDQQAAELRERRRAKILASKDARLSRITGAHNDGSSQESIKVDEIVLQEFIAESKKQAVELAKEDYAKTHLEHEAEADEKLTPEQVKERQASQLQQRLTQLHENSPNSKLELFISSLFVLIAAATAAFFLLKRVGSDSIFCLDFRYGVAFDKIAECRQRIAPHLLEIVPTAFGVSLLPLVSEFFKGRKSFPQILLLIIPRSLLFLISFLLFLRLLQ